jgi:DNA topoisomerase I
MSKDIQLEAYCLKCREHRVMVQPRAEWASNGAAATRGTCPVCGSQLYKRGRTAAHDSLEKPEPQNNSQRPSRRMGKLVVVESPAKARTIGKYLGRDYRVMSSVGHVRDLLKSRLSVDVENEYEPEYRVPNDKRKVVQGLQAAGEKAAEIYLATDPDREGEAIAWHVRESAGFDPNRTRRVVFQEITKPAILEAFKQPRTIDMDRVDAQQARRILDRLVGYKLSPLLWRKVRGRLSAGRVQSVAVRLIVEREREIEAFEPEEYWTLTAELSRQATRGLDPRPFFVAKLNKIRGQDPVLATAEDVSPHLELLRKAEWTVTDVRLGKRVRRPAAPFTTSTLQQEASRRLNFGANKAMRLAQGLYEGIELGPKEEATGLITYMRTDSLSVAGHAQEEARAHIVEHFGSEYAPDEAPTYKTRSKTAQEAHEAIRPTSVERSPKRLKRFLARDQYRLYRLIWERFVASQMSPAIYDTVSVDIMAGDKAVLLQERAYLFRASGSTLRFAGFLALYEETEPTDRPENGESHVPSDLLVSEVVDLQQLLPEQHFTQAPPRFTEATLVKELEENGIGRPSTYASIISTITSRGYVEYVDKRLKPTDIGELVTSLLVDHFPDVMSVDFTARLEDELDDIAGGKPWRPVIDGFYQRFSRRLEAADQAIEKVTLEAEPVGRDCPLCGNPLIYREGRYGRFIGCSNFPKCRYTEQILNKIGVTCPQDGGDVVEKRTRKGRVFYGCANYPECDWTSWKRPLREPCPTCGGLTVEVNKSHAECTKCGERHELSLLVSGGQGLND